MSVSNSDTLLFGVYFNHDGTVDEKEVKQEFYCYGKVHSVKQIQSRVYVNFFSKEAAEKVLKGRHEKYGAISKGRFGPKEQRDSDSNSTKGYPRKNYAQKNDSSNYASQQDQDDLGETELNCNSTRRDVQPSEKQTSPRGQMSNPNQNKKSPKQNENRVSGEVYDSLKSFPAQHGVNNSLCYNQSKSCLFDEDSQGDGPPELLSIHHRPRSSINNHYEDKESLPPLVPVSASPVVSHNSHSRESALSHRLLTNNVQSHKSQNGINIPSDKSCRDMPPLVQNTVSTSLENGLNTYNDETSDPFLSYSKQVLMANLPMDITQNEIEKILYPLEPICISNIDVTNIRLKISFVQILFSNEEEANQAAKQFDGLSLRGHNLTVRKVIDLVSME